MERLIRFMFPWFSSSITVHENTLYISAMRRMVSDLSGVSQMWLRSVVMRQCITTHCLTVASCYTGSLTSRWSLCCSRFESPSTFYHSRNLKLCVSLQQLCVWAGLKVVIVNGVETPTRNTSAASPVVAAISAPLNDTLIRAGQLVTGIANPWLYGSGVRWWCNDWIVILNWYWLYWPLLRTGPM